MITLAQMSALKRHKALTEKDLQYQDKVIIHMLMMITLDHLARGGGRPTATIVWSPGSWPGGLRDARQSGPLAPCHARTLRGTSGHSRAASPPGHRRGLLAPWPTGPVAMLPATWVGNWQCTTKAKNLRAVRKFC